MSKINSKWVNLVFCIDSSGSMYGSTSDVVGGYDRIIEENKKQDGKTTVSLFTFNSTVDEKYVGVDINDVPKFKYRAEGMTKLYDGVCIAIDKVGKWLYEKDANGEEMPSKTIFVIMTDGMENSSEEFTLQQVKDKIKEQTYKYSWTFVYEGVDVTTTKEADNLGIKFRTYSSRKNITNNYDIINTVTSSYRCAINEGASADDAERVLCATMDTLTTTNTKAFEEEIGQKITTA